MNEGLVIGAISSYGHEDGHVGVLDQSAEVETIHVCAATELVKVENLAGASSKVVSTTTDVSALLARDDLDAVIVCARPDHAPAILEQVVASGQSVLYDKPAAVHSSQMQRVAELARAKGVTAGAMLQWRYHPMLHTTYRLIQAAFTACTARRVAGTQDGPVTKAMRSPKRLAMAASWPRSFFATSFSPRKRVRLPLRPSKILSTCWKSLRRPKSHRPRDGP